MSSNVLWSQGSGSACISTGLSGVGFGLRRLEEGVGQLPEPHGHGLGHVGRLGVHDGVEERLQVGLRVPPDVHDLVAGGGGLRRRLGRRGSRLPGRGRRALARSGLRGRRLRRRLLPGIHGASLPDARPWPGGRGLRPDAALDGRDEERALTRARRCARSRGRGAADSTIFSFSRNFLTDFHSDCLGLHCQPRDKKVSFNHIFTSIFFSVFLMKVILAGIRWSLSVVFISISLMGKYVVHFFSYT